HPSFIFQAGEGVRAGHVTGVQTCALPFLDTSFELLTRSLRSLTVHSSHVASASIFPLAPAVNPVADAADASTVVFPPQFPEAAEIGRASCRERVSVAVVDVEFHGEE